jgi:hypothetical protein
LYSHLDLSSTYEKKRDLCLSEPGLFHLTRSSPVPCIYLQTKTLNLLNVEFCKEFFCIYWDDHVIFALSVYGLDYIYSFSYFELSQYLCNKINWIMTYDFLDCCWILFASILLDVFICVHWRNLHIILFFDCVLVWSGDECKVLHSCVFFPFLFHGKVWEVLVSFFL